MHINLLLQNISIIIMSVHSTVQGFLQYFTALIHDSSTNLVLNVFVANSVTVSLFFNNNLSTVVLGFLALQFMLWQCLKL